MRFVKIFHVDIPRILFLVKNTQMYPKLKVTKRTTTREQEK